MKDNELLKMTVEKTTRMFGVDIQEIKERKDWKQYKDTFIDMVQRPMVCLKDFGFTDSEIQEFLRATEEELHICLALVVLRKAIDGCHNMAELEGSFSKIWFSEKVLDELADMADTILNSYVIAKGGQVF